jgi:hypothetical protein
MFHIVLKVDPQGDPSAAATVKLPDPAPGFTTRPSSAVSFPFIGLVGCAGTVIGIRLNVGVIENCAIPLAGG